MVAIGTYNDLQPEPAQPVDRNPSIPCERCGESYNWQDYWEDRLSDDPREQAFWCESCWGELIEQARIERYAKEHHQLTEWSE
jgi:hypothetical protein